MTITLRYEPRGAARLLFSARNPEVLLSGPAGTGKSRACLEKLHQMCLVNPFMRGLIVRKTQTSLANTALETYRKAVAKEFLRTGQVEYYGGSAQEPPQYKYANGSTINIGGMDKPTRIMSSEYDVIYVQEATELTETDWENLTTRLRNGRVTFQQLIADCNPDMPTHWLKIRSDLRRTLLLESRHTDNPTLYERDGTLTTPGAAYMSVLDNLTGIRRLRLRDGKWAAAEGLIYEEYDPLIHLIDRFDIPDEWSRYWTVDFGFTNPFVLQWWAEDPDGRLYLYREIYHTQRLVEDHAEKALKFVRTAKGVWLEPKPRAIICDHDAEGRATLVRKLGLNTIAAHKAVTEGIQAAQKRFKLQADDKPRIYIMRDSLVERDKSLLAAKKPTCTAEELPGYVWETGTDGSKKEQPRKLDDHGCDALRYVVAQRDLRGTVNFRRL